MPRHYDHAKTPQTCDAYGYEALTLDGLLTQLRRTRDLHAATFEMPVYVGTGRVYQPVNSVRIEKQADGTFTLLLGLAGSG